MAQSPRLRVGRASSSSHEGVSEELVEGREKGRGGKREEERGEAGVRRQQLGPCCVGPGA